MALNWSNSRQAPDTSCLACDGAGSGWRPDNIRRAGCFAGALMRLMCFHLTVVDEETTSNGGNKRSCQYQSAQDRCFQSGAFEEQESEVILWNGVDGLWTRESCVNMI